MSLDGNLCSEYLIKGRVNKIPGVDRTLTQSGKAADAKVTGEALEQRVKKTDIVDDLKTFDEKKPLSAKQGAVLKIMFNGLKTSGTYVGNGSAETRAISIGGAGRVAIVYTSDYFTFVTPDNAVSIGLSEGMITSIDSAQAAYTNGNLVLNTDDATFNAEGTTYYYQVL